MASDQEGKKNTEILKAIRQFRREMKSDTGMEVQKITNIVARSIPLALNEEDPEHPADGLLLFAFFAGAVFVFDQVLEGK